jgi:membrane protease YdiL (CAAX protease family)
MTVISTARDDASARPWLLLAGFGASVVLRQAIGGSATATSAKAGLAFAVALGALTLAARVPIRLTPSATVYGLGGAAILCIPVVATSLLTQSTSHRPAGSFLAWATVVTTVALAEEAFLRGVLFTALVTWRGSAFALIVTSGCFAGLHIPLYGWHTVVINTAVGLCLGVTRQLSGTWTAPAITHICADLAAWWLR